MNAPQVSIDDLAFAVDWMDTYDGRDEDGTLSDNDHAAERVAAWLVAEISRRREDAAVRLMVRKTGATAKHARTVIRGTVRDLAAEHNMPEAAALAGLLDALNRGDEDQ